MDATKTPDLWVPSHFNLKEFRTKPPTGPLGKVIDSMFAFKADERRENGGLPILRALTNWYRLQIVIHILGHDFLSCEHQYSYCLLFDWWTAAIQHPMVTLESLKMFLGFSPTLVKEWQDQKFSSERSRLWDYIRLHLSMLMLAGNTQQTDDFKSEVGNAYNGAMFRLFIAEFAYNNPEEDNPGLQLMKGVLTAIFVNYDFEDEKLDVHLKMCRRDAAIQSYCKQAGVECLRNILPSLNIPSVKLLDPEYEIFTVKTSMPKFSRGFGRGPLMSTCIPKSRSYMNKYEDSEDEDDEIYEAPESEDKNEKEKGSNIEDKKEKDTGSDIEDENEEERQKEREKESNFDRLGGWPEYLWDLKSSRTVRTSALGYPRPNYTTISHTWGRSVLPGPGCIIPGGLLYPIPLNKAFDVNALPDNLKALQNKISSPFIWIDILCIPQGDEDTMKAEDKKIRLREIGRQRQIFENAESSIAWLHDVDDLSCLAEVFQWLCVSIFDVKNGTENARIRDQVRNRLLDAINDRRTGLVKPWKGETEDELAVADQPGRYKGVTVGSSWFNSLWTFQELCLRPDTYLATSRLDIMSLERGQPIPLNGLVCIYNKFVTLGRLKEENPPALQDLFYWHRCTRLGQLLDFTLIDILMVGAQRYCKERKAEAIMSAIGATSWFTKTLAETGYNEQSFKRTGYHPAFIQEVLGMVKEELMITPNAGPSAGDENWYHGPRVKIGDWTDIRSSEDARALELYSHSLSRIEQFLEGLSD
ncbi:hypothetical protein Trisim1_006324 [Trichoderma cf. simile WF8]